MGNNDAMTDKQVKRADHTDIDAIANTIADAFRDDKIMNWIFGGAPALEAATRLFLRDVYMPYGHVTHVGDGAGAAMWMPPGGRSSLSLMSILKFAPIVALNAGPQHILRGLAVSRRLDRLKPEAPHHYLFMVGVAHDAQGKGYGGLLIREGLQRADAEVTPVYLETSTEKNIGIYSGMGFKVVHETIPAEGAPTVWTMLRQPRRCSKWLTLKRRFKFPFHERSW